MVLTFKSCEPVDIEFPLPTWTAEVDLNAKGIRKPWVQSHLPTLVVIDVSDEQWDQLFDILGPFSSESFAVWCVSRRFKLSCLLHCLLLSAVCTTLLQPQRHQQLLCTLQAPLCTLMQLWPSL